MNTARKLTATEMYQKQYIQRAFKRAESAAEKFVAQRLPSGEFLIAAGRWMIRAPEKMQYHLDWLRSVQDATAITSGSPGQSCRDADEVAALMRHYVGRAVRPLSLTNMVRDIGYDVRVLYDAQYAPVYINRDFLDLLGKTYSELSMYTFRQVLYEGETPTLQAGAPVVAFDLTGAPVGIFMGDVPQEEQWARQQPAQSQPQPQPQPQSQPESEQIYG